jgi:hypothetical protein
MSYRPRTAFILASLIGITLVLPAVTFAEDISGVITTTRTIRDNSRLVGNVTCIVAGAPCISFGASRIDLRLNGFTITGQADPATGCSGTFQASENGITTNGQTDVEIRGPGIVQRFRANGILFSGTLLGKVEGITASTNCQSGILVNATSSRITVAANIAVRNGTPQAACGGI